MNRTDRLKDGQLTEIGLTSYALHSYIIQLELPAIDHGFIVYV